MRKQKVIKMTASPLDPSLGGSFQPPATHNGDISIVFRGKNMSIHGWDGSAWSTIYTRNGDDKQFAFPHTYQNYYVKSLTGSDETFSASFFSTGKYERSTPLLAGVQRDTKLHDIEEVPIYTASDVNKLLTIMSDGSLRWLGISESYVVEVIGTGGESQAPSEEPQITGTFLEELPAATSNLYNSAEIVDGIFSQTSGDNSLRGATKVDLAAEGIMSYSSDSLDPKEWTLSFWIKSEAEMGSGYHYCGGRFESNHELRLAMGNVGGFMQFKPIFGALWTGTPTATSTTAFAVGQWHHCAMTYSLSDGFTDKYDLKVFIDGVKGGEALQQNKHVLDKMNGSDNVWFGLGKGAYGQAFNGNWGQFSMDSVQIKQGALTDEQVAAIAAQSDRQMYIEEAATL